MSSVYELGWLLYLYNKNYQFVIFFEYFIMSVKNIKYEWYSDKDKEKMLYLWIFFF